MSHSSTKEAAGSHPPAPAPPTPKRSPMQRIMGLLPPWITAALHDRRHWKNFVRTMIALFVCTVLMVCQESLDAIGSATFFALITVCILSPSMPLAIYLFATLTMGLGMLLGWAGGIAAFASGLNVRDQARLQQQMQEVQQSFSPDLPPKLQLQSAIFRGEFLDPRSSAVTGVFVFLGTYALGWMRASKPKLMLMSIFGTIVFDLMTTFGPLFPVKSYMIAKALMVPGAVGLAVGLACTIVFFPQTLNHHVLGGLVKGALGPIQELLNMQDDVLISDPSDNGTWDVLATKAARLRKGFAAGAGALAASSQMLQLEISRGRISAGELTELITRTRELGSRAFGLGSFVMMVEERRKALRLYKDNPLPHHTAKTREMAMDSVKAELESGRSLKDLLPDLDASTSDLRRAAQEALNGAAAFLTLINDTRWKSKLPADTPTMADRDASRERLMKALDEYRSSKHFAILSKFQDMFDAKGQLIPSSERDLSGQVRGLFRCFVFTTALIAFSSSLVEYLDFIRMLEVSNPKNKLQFPGKFVQTMVENANDPGDNQHDYTVNDPLADNEQQEAQDDMLNNKQDSMTSDADKKKTRASRYPRNPDAREPRNAFQRFGRFLARVMRGLTGPNGMFALRYALVSVAMWAPAVAPSSAKFYFENRGLWALIMAQTGLGIVAGEQLFNVVSRVSGTCIGVVAGMIIWYIGAQKGSGNPYGIAAATTVGMLPFIFCRVAAPHSSMPFWILTSVSVVFAVGYSWVDMNIVQSANQGAGYTLAGRRALLVLIGFAAGTIVAMLPRPISAKKLVREGLSKNIVAIGELYGLEVASFEQSRHDLPQVDREERRSRYRDRLLKVFGRFTAIELHVAYAGMEPGLQGPWPKQEYEQLIEIQKSILSASATVSNAYAQLDTPWIKRLTDRAEVLHPTFVADCFSLFAILRHSLRYKVPLPPMIPIFERLAFHRRNSRARYIASRAIGRAKASDATRGGDTDSLNVPPATSDGGDATLASVSRANTPTNVDGSSVTDTDDEDRLLTADKVLWDALQGTLTWQLAHDEQFAISATAIIGLIHIVSGLNTMHSVILDLVGERELEGFDLAHERWAVMETV